MKVVLSETERSHDNIVYLPKIRFWCEIKEVAPNIRLIRTKACLRVVYGTLGAPNYCVTIVEHYD